MNNRDTFLRKYAHSYDSLPVQKKFWLITKQLSSWNLKDVLYVIQGHLNSI